MPSVNLPNTLGQWLASLASAVAVLAAVGALYLHLHTDLEAEEIQKQLESTIITVQEKQNEVNYALRQSIDRSEILRLRREVKRLKSERLDPDLNVVQIANIDADIEYYEDIIECIQEQRPTCL